MNNPWAFAILSLALISAATACNLPRAAAWVCLAMVSFIATSLWWDYGDHQSHAIFTFVCDALLVLVMTTAIKERWEVIVCGAFLVSVAVSLARIPGAIPGNLIYASLLELCNFVALITIGGVGLMDRIARHANNAPLLVLRSLRSARHSV